MNAIRMLACGAALLSLLSACKDEKPAALSRAAPEPGVLGADGRTVALADLKGKVVLINFWFSGCGPCIAEMPDLEAYYQRHRNKGFEILAINMTDSKEEVAKVGRRLGVSFPLLTDPLKIATTRYAVQGAPTSFVVDRAGVIRDRHEGRLMPKHLDGKVGALM